jgi:hypothetical protein
MNDEAARSCMKKSVLTGLFSQGICGDFGRMCEDSTERDKENLRRFKTKW